MSAEVRIMNKTIWLLYKVMSPAETVEVLERRTLRWNGKNREKSDQEPVIRCQTVMTDCYLPCDSNSFLVAHVFATDAITQGWCIRWSLSQCSINPSHSSASIRSEGERPWDYDIARKTAAPTPITRQLTLTSSSDVMEKPTCPLCCDVII